MRKLRARSWCFPSLSALVRSCERWKPTYGHVSSCRHGARARAASRPHTECAGRHWNRMKRKDSHCCTSTRADSKPATQDLCARHSCPLHSTNELHPVPSSFLPHRVDGTRPTCAYAARRTHRTLQASNAHTALHALLPRARTLSLFIRAQERESTRSQRRHPGTNNQAAAARVPHVPPLAPHHEADATHDTRDLTRLTNRPPEPISVRETPCMRETIACSMSMHTPRATRRAPRTNIAKARLRNQKRDSSTAGGWPPCTHIE